MPTHPADEDIGRNYSDPIDADVPRMTMRPAPPFPWSIHPVHFMVFTSDGHIQRPIYHPHLAFLKLLKDYRFDSIMDIGCGDGNEADLCKFLGKTVFTINADPNPRYKVDFFGDYLDLKTPQQFDAIWCSHVLEHVRNPGAFLDKVYDDLKDGGVFAVSVPYNEFNSGPDSLTVGHHNRYNFLLLIYQLVCAGFDCAAANVAMRIYNGQISVLVRKKANNLPRNTMAVWQGSLIQDFFPEPIRTDGGNNSSRQLNWETFFNGAPLIEPASKIW